MPDTLNDSAAPPPDVGHGPSEGRGVILGGGLLLLPLFLLVAHWVNVAFADGGAGWLLWLTAALGVVTLVAMLLPEDGTVGGSLIVVAWLVWIPALVVAPHVTPDAPSRDEGVLVTDDEGYDDGRDSFFDGDPVCEQLRSGASRLDVTYMLSASGEFHELEAAALVGASIAQNCPEFR